MSLILDALNKADSERSKNNTPSLNSNHDAIASDASTKSNTRVIFALGTITILLLIALVVLFLKDKDNVKDRDNAKDRRNAEVSVKAPVPASSQKREIASQTPTKSSASEKQPLDFAPPETVKPEKAISQQDDEKYAQIKKKLIEAQYKKAAEEPIEPVVQKPEEKQVKITSIYEKSHTVNQQNATSSEQPNSNADSLKQFTKIGNIRDLPTAIQQSIPTIMYSAHNYNSNNASVTLNNKKRKKGQQVSDQLYIEYILRDGIILRFREHKFKMSALSSWVNL